MVRNTCIVNNMDVPDWHVDIGGNYVKKSRASCRVWLHVEQDQTQTEQSLLTVVPLADAQFRSPQSNMWSLQSTIIQASTSDNSFMNTLILVEGDVYKC